MVVWGWRRGVFAWLFWRIVRSGKDLMKDWVRGDEMRFNAVNMCVEEEVFKFQASVGYRES